jgi:hypothetical protein
LVIEAQASYDAAIAREAMKEVLVRIPRCSLLAAELLVLRAVS